MEVSDYILVPPAAFLLALLLAWLFSRLTAGFRHADIEAEGKNLPYACGEDVSSQKAEPEYGAFFPFAIFFTLLHVAGLMIATWSGASGAGAALGGLIYLAVIGATLGILFLG
ncbi:MAG: NADH-quinone oxidoreductase subunit A [Elusimicrobiales bacterium]|nr:NADH-quinone oxidoreductase subunit A [Elusimicrobiales bacterium]